MAKILNTKIVLPTPTEFIRYVSRILLFNQRAGRDTDTKLAPLVTRAKSLTSRSGLLLETSEKELGNG